ncbi:MAG: peptidylprolyl isomerase [Elusimicrobiales bacterium]
MKATNKLLLAALAAPLFCGAAACKVMEDSIATVNGEPILRSEYSRNLAAMAEQYRAVMPKFFEQKDADKKLTRIVLDKMIDNLLIEQEAEKNKVRVHARELDERMEKLKKQFSVDETGKPLSPSDAEANFRRELKKEGIDEEQFRQRLSRQMAAEKYVSQSLQPKIKQPSDEEVRKFFEQLQFVVKGDTSPLAAMSPEDAQETAGLAQNLKDMGAERASVQHIFFKAPENAPLADKSKALEQAKAVKKELDAGADFGDTARKNSQDAESAARGGDIGPVIKGMGLPAEFERQAFAAQVGAVSEPFETPLGWHIIRVMSHTASQPVKFEDVKDRLSGYLMNRQFRGEVTKLVKELRVKSSIAEQEDKSGS